MDKKEIPGVAESPTTVENEEAMAEQLMMNEKTITKMEWDLAYLNLRGECYRFLFALEGISFEMEEPLAETHQLTPQSRKLLKEVQAEMCRQALDDAQGLIDLQIGMHYLRQLATKPLKLNKMGPLAKRAKKAVEEKLNMLYTGGGATREVT